MLVLRRGAGLSDSLGCRPPTLAGPMKTGWTEIWPKCPCVFCETLGPGLGGRGLPPESFEAQGFCCISLGTPPLALESSELGSERSWEWPHPWGILCVCGGGWWEDDCRRTRSSQKRREEVYIFVGEFHLSLELELLSSLLFWAGRNWELRPH